MPLTQVQNGMLAGVIPASLGGTGTTAGVTGFKNRIINGDMVIDQRNAGASVTITDTGALTYTLDRWAAYGNNASKFSVQQNAGSVTLPAGYTNYLGVTSLAATTVGTNDQYTLSQAIEGYNAADLNWGSANAKTVTLSFWVRSSLTGTFSGVFVNGALDRGYGYTYTISTANTWEQKTITIAGDTSGTWLTTNGTGIRIYWGLGVGSLYSATPNIWTSGSYRSATGGTNLVSTNGATLYLTGVQLEVGSQATNFDYLPYGTELMLCQRYYEETNNNRSVEFQIHAITNGLNSTRFQVRKRTTPTVVVYSSNTGVANTVNNGNGNVQTSISGYASYPDCFAVQMAGTTSQMYTYFFTASAEL